MDVEHDGLPHGDGFGFAASDFLTTSQEDLLLAVSRALPNGRIIHEYKLARAICAHRSMGPPEAPLSLVRRWLSILCPSSHALSTGSLPHV
jgi:hypothetical protein